MANISCKDCGHIFPKSQNEPRRACPKCGSKLKSYSIKFETGYYKYIGYPIVLKTLEWIEEHNPLFKIIANSLFILGVVLSLLFLWIGGLVLNVAGIIIVNALTYLANQYGKEKKIKHRKETIYK